MAVTKIHKTSRMTLYAIIGITLVVLALFFFGGNVPLERQTPALAGLNEPTNTSMLLYWIYILLGVTVVVLLLFAIVGFFTSLKTKPKSAINSLLVLVALVALFVITYAMGSGTPLNIVGYTGPDNIPSRLRMTDMWIFSIYLMLVLTILSIFFAPLLKIFRKK